jgi:HEAT repeat protein
MKTDPRRFRGYIFRAVGGILIGVAGLLSPIKTQADGCFVVPKFVWDKHKDINEPTQKAIIAYNAGYEAMVLQVKYAGPVEEFGWLIPVPNIPTVTEGSMECFYELSKYTQRRFEQRRAEHTMMSSGAGLEPEPPVKVIEIRTLGAYRIAVLSAKDSGALESWLAANEFYLPADNGGVIDSYVKQGWCFVAAKINLSKTAGWELASGTPKTGATTTASIKEKLSSGELRPLYLSFESDKCVFPLKISSINGKPSEVQVYVLSKEPLVEKGTVAEKLAQHYRWRTNELARRDAFSKEMLARRADSPMAALRQSATPEINYRLSGSAMINDAELLPYAQVSSAELPRCSKEIMLPDNGPCWLTKQTWSFKPEEMRDLEFVPAVPALTAYLADQEGYYIAANLSRLGAGGAIALLSAMQSTNEIVRSHATAGAGRVSQDPGYSEVNNELPKLLPALFKDSNPEVRLHAIEAANEYPNPKYFDAAVALLRDDQPEIVDEAVSYLTQPDLPLKVRKVSEHIPLFHQMLKDTNSSVQMAGLRVLLKFGVTPLREELLPLFSVPRREVAGPAVAILRERGISGDEAKPLLVNSDVMVRMMGLATITQNATKDSVDLAIPLLRDNEQLLRLRTRDMLADLTGQDFPVEQPERWEKWWAENKPSFAVDLQQVEKRRLKRRQERAATLRQQVPDASLPKQPQNQRQQ